MFMKVFILGFLSVSYMFNIFENLNWKINYLLTLKEVNGQT